MYNNSKLFKNTAKKKRRPLLYLNETPEQANACYLKEHGINPTSNADAAQTQPKADAAKAEEAS